MQITVDPLFASQCHYPPPFSPQFSLISGAECSTLRFRALGTALPCAERSAQGRVGFFLVLSARHLGAERSAQGSVGFFLVPSAQHFGSSLRTQIISIISQCGCNFDPLLSYLAVNYLDRFLSIQGIPQPNPWLIKLFAISCVSLAAKMIAVDHSLADLQAVGRSNFDTQTIQRMEFIILGALKWKMRSITPFSFIPFFVASLQLDDPRLLRALKARASDIITKAQTEILEFKPSVIAEIKLLEFKPSVIVAFGYLRINDF